MLHFWLSAILFWRSKTYLHFQAIAVLEVRCRYKTIYTKKQKNRDTTRVFFVGGILSSLSMGREPNWFLFIPYLADYTQMLFSGNRFALDWAIVDFFWHRGRRALLQGQRMVHEGIR
jgi:hypothetical protein